MRWIVRLALCSIVTSCVIPSGHTLAHSARRPTEDQLEFLAHAETTREDVLLRLGEPTRVAERERLFVYLWDLGIVMIPYGGFPTGMPGGVDTLSQRRGLWIEFDSRGHVREHGTTSRLGWNTPDPRPTERDQ